MENAIGQRLMVVASNFKLSQNKFAEAIGQKETTLNQWILNNKWTDVDKLESVLRQFPELSRDWLYAGVGEMIKQRQPYQDMPNLSVVSDGSRCDGCMIKDGIINEYRTQTSGSIASLHKVCEELKHCLDGEKNRKAC